MSLTITIQKTQQKRNNSNNNEHLNEECYFEGEDIIQLDWVT